MNDRMNDELDKLIVHFWMNDRMYAQLDDKMIDWTNDWMMDGQVNKWIKFNRINEGLDE
jgi:hypothetical protein